MSHAIVGVQRSVLDPALGNHDLETTGNLWVEPAHGEQITARIILYTLDLGAPVGDVRRRQSGPVG